MSPPTELPPSQDNEGTEPIGKSAVPLHISKKRYLIAFLIAGISDVICFYATPVPPVVWAADVVTAVLLFVVLGWQWLLLPGLIIEAIPGIGVIPIWVLVVGGIALWGTARPNLSLFGKNAR